jgi:hypothetical protein
LLPLPSALQVKRQLKERLVVVLVRQIRSQLQAPAVLHSVLLVGFPSALPLHPQLKERSVVGLEHQREVCSRQLRSLSGQLQEAASLVPLRQLVSVRQRVDRSVPLPEEPWVVPLLPLPSALQVNWQLKERLVVVLVWQIQSRLQARGFLHSELLVGFPSALQLHPQLKERSVVGLEQQRKVCPGQLLSFPVALQPEQLGRRL